MSHKKMSERGLAVPTVDLLPESEETSWVEEVSSFLLSNFPITLIQTTRWGFSLPLLSSPHPQGGLSRFHCSIILRGDFMQGEVSTLEVREPWA